MAWILNGRKDVPFHELEGMNNSTCIVRGEYILSAPHLDIVGAVK